MMDATARRQAERRFLGGIKVHADDGIPLAAYRCPRLRNTSSLYARPA
jgi:hypothetical protein